MPPRFVQAFPGPSPFIFVIGRGPIFDNSPFLCCTEPPDRLPAAARIERGVQSLDPKSELVKCSAMSVQIYPLSPSPVSAARRRRRITRTEAARRLGISLGHLRVVEAQTRRISPVVLDRIVRALDSSEPDQLSLPLPLFEALAAHSSVRAAGGEHGRA